MDTDTRNLQNDFFNAARKDRSVVTVFLGNGKKLTGRIKSFDKFTLLLESHGSEQIVFKHAISTVASGRGGHLPGDDAPHRSGEEMADERRPAGIDD